MEQILIKSKIFSRKVKFGLNWGKFRLNMEQIQVAISENLEVLG